MNSLYYKKLYTKNFGQNFLHKESIIKKIIFFIHPEKKDLLIEIGPGYGALTLPIIKYVDILYAIEIDKKLFDFLKNNIKNKIVLFNENVLKFNFFNLLNDKKKKIRIFGNLPYKISTNLIFYLFKYQSCIYDMHFMFQKEVANRLIAKPNNKNYCRLSVMAQYFYKIIPLLEVRPESFYPVPNVYSTFLRFLPRKNNIKNKINILLLNNILKAAFGQRRKILSNSLKNFFSLMDLNKILTNSNIRAENLNKEDFYKLSYFYEKKLNKI